VPFTQRLTIRFDQVDYARVVYYPRFFELSHQVFEAFFEQAVGVSYPKMLMEQKVGFPTVHCEADFKRPLKFGDQVDVHLEPVKVGEKSVECRYRFVPVGQSEPAAVLTVVTVAIEMDTFKGRAVPENVRKAFEAAR